jgi:hypothetical protein
MRAASSPIRSCCIERVETVAGPALAHANAWTATAALADAGSSTQFIRRAVVNARTAAASSCSSAASASAGVR